MTSTAKAFSVNAVFSLSSFPAVCGCDLHLVSEHSKVDPEISECVTCSLEKDCLHRPDYCYVVEGVLEDVVLEWIAFSSLGTIVISCSGTWRTSCHT